MLAGGQSLVPMLALRLTRFEHLVDVNRVGELRGFARENGTLVVRRGHPPAGHGARPARSRPPCRCSRWRPRSSGTSRSATAGTVGGSLAHADPASEYPAVAVALGAELELARPRRHAPSGRGRRLLRRHVDDRGRARRAARRGALPGVAAAQRVRDRGGRAPPRRLRARRRRRARSTDGRGGHRAVRRRARRRCGPAPPRTALVAGAPPGRRRRGRSRASSTRPPTCTRRATTRTRIARHLVERAVARAQEDLRAAG